VAAALLIVDLAAGAVPFPGASRLIRSPFIAAAGKELTSRARLDVELRRGAGATIGLDALRRMVERLTSKDHPFPAPACPQLLALLSRIGKQALGGTKSAGEWGRAISALLDWLYQSHPDVLRVEARVRVSDASGIRLLEKLKFIREGSIRHERSGADGALLYGLLRSEWTG
jgi:hypothetical protein